jgi:hypothetical protein
MKLSPLVSALSAAALTAVLGWIAPLHADVTRAPVAAKDDGPKAFPARRAAPPALESAKKALKYTAAVKALGALIPGPQQLEMKVTPVAMRHPSGAEILSAGPGYVRGVDNGEPDGSYHLLTRKGGGLSLTSVLMKFPTEKNRHYVVDCKVNPPSGPALRYSLGKPVFVEDGHLITGFLANSNQTELSLLVFPAEGSTSDDLGDFYGCEVGKAGG